MANISILPIELLQRRQDARPLNDAALAGLEESIKQIGLINPLRVRKLDLGVGYEVIAGSHRFSACDAAGLREIPCIIVTDDDLHAELAMIDENLMRAELSPVDRAKQTARRKAIYEQLNPETKHGGNLQGAGVANLSSPETPAFSTATANLTGQSERSVQRDAERGEKVFDEAANLIRGTKLDTGVYLDKLKKLTPSEQVYAAKRDLAWEKRRAKEDRPKGGVAGRYQQVDTKPNAVAETERFFILVGQIEAIRVEDLLNSGRLRAAVGQRASGLADHLNEIVELLDK